MPKGHHAVISVQAGDAGFNRAVVGLRGVHILRGIHAADKNGFDHVTAKMAADNRVAIDIDLSALIAARGIARQRALQRYRDVMVLQNRFGFPLTVSSNARSVLDLRATREVSGLLSLLDMDLPVIERALNGVAEVTTPLSACGEGDPMTVRPPTLRDKRRYLLVRVDPPGTPIDQKELYYAIADAVTSLFGDVVAAIMVQAVICAEGDRHIVIRCRRGTERELAIALSTITACRDTRIALRIVAASGTIESLRERLRQKADGRAVICDRGVTVLRRRFR